MRFTIGTHFERNPWRYLPAIFLLLLTNCDEKEISFSLTTIVDGNGTVNPSEGVYKKGDRVELLATPDPGFLFVGWSGSIESMDNPLTVTMDGDKSIKATFSDMLVNSDGKTGLIADFDGNAYNIVKIGSQWWMAQSLNTTSFNDGTVIALITDNTSWGNATGPAFCWLDNVMSAGPIFGALYNWYAINTGKLCPLGWRVPSAEDWFLLAEFLGGESVAGGKMKTTTWWEPPNTGASNESGFSGLPGGLRVNDGEFIQFGFSGYWWSTEFVDDEPRIRNLTSLQSKLINNNSSVNWGISCRCIKN